MHLNGWQRSGIVASGVWAIVGGLWGNDYGIHQGDWVMVAYRLCLEHQTDWGSCDRTLQREWPAAISGHWLSAALAGLAPIPVGWFVAFLIVALLRWVRKGFNARSR
jgi:hypothetical protein